MFDRSIVKIADIDWHHTDQGGRLLRAIGTGVLKLGQTPLIENNFIMSDQLGRKASRYKRQRLLALAILVAATVPVYSEPKPVVESKPVVGHPVDLNGDWFVYDSTRGDETAKKLTKWQDLPPGGVIRIKSPSIGDYINIIGRDLKQLEERICNPVERCFQPIYLPWSADDEPATDVFVAAALNLLAGAENERSMHRVRGLLLQSEGVVSVRDGGIDLGEPMHGIIKGRYVLAACNQEVTCEQEAITNSQKEVVFDWSPDLTPIPLVGRLTPGIYSITPTEGSDQSAGSRISVRILVCASRAFASTEAAFHKVRMLADKWSGESAHAFLRAYLVQLNRSGICLNE